MGNSTKTYTADDCGFIHSTPAAANGANQRYRAARRSAGDPDLDAVPGGRPGDVPRFVPRDQLNTGPRDDHGRLRAGEPRTVEARLADLFETGKLELYDDEIGEHWKLSDDDQALVIAALRRAAALAVPYDTTLTKTTE